MTASQPVAGSCWSTLSKRWRSSRWAAPSANASAPPDCADGILRHSSAQRCCSASARSRSRSGTAAAVLQPRSAC
eukprot:2729565-Prymnesium_polylepis.1